MHFWWTHEKSTLLKTEIPHIWKRQVGQGIHQGRGCQSGKGEIQPHQILAEATHDGHNVHRCGVGDAMGPDGQAFQMGMVRVQAAQEHKELSGIRDALTRKVQTHCTQRSTRVKLSDETIPWAGAGLGIASEVEMTQRRPQRIAFPWIEISCAEDSM